MTDPRIVNLAKTLVHYSTKVQPGDHVAIYGTPHATPLIQAVYREVLRAGGYPYTMVGVDGLQEIYFQEANDDQLKHVSRVTKMVYGEFNAMIAIEADANTRNLSHADIEKQRTRAQANAGLMQTYMRRSAAKEFKWSIAMFPTNAYAQDAEMSLADFEDYVYGAVYADTDDAVAEWRKFSEMQQRLVDWLKGKKRVEVKGPACDLTLLIDGRAFINCDGESNMPDGEIHTAPVEDSVEGWIRYSYPAVTQGREVEGIELTFEKGRVVKATAEKNEEFLVSQLDTDEGARHVGEFAIGTNKKIDRFIKNLLFDEKLGGTIHMAVGSGYPETGSKNESAIHWDMICDMKDGGEIYVDGTLFYRSGEFMV